MSSFPPPVVVYPNTVAIQSGQHSKGSFVPVFVVLAVILVLLGFSCCVGQLCSRRFTKPKPKAKARRGGGSCSGNREEDIEFGFKKKVPSTKAAVADNHHHQEKPKHVEFENGEEGAKKAETKRGENVGRAKSEYVIEEGKPLSHKVVQDVNV